MSDKKILDLGALAPDRPIVKFRDGSQHEMISIEELSLADRAKIQKLSGAVNDKNAESLSTAIDEILSVLLPGIGNDDLEKLTELEKTRIMNFFTQLAEGGVPNQETGELIQIGEK